MQLAYRDSRPDLEHTESRRQTAQLLMRLFAHWELSGSQKLALLGLSPNSRSQLPKLERGEAGLQKGRDALDRAGYLLAIHKALRLLYPYNPQLRYSWVKRPNALLDNRRPIDLMTEQGIIGLAKVARLLDHQRGL